MFLLLDLYKDCLENLGEFAEAFSLKEEIKQRAALIKMGVVECDLFSIVHFSKFFAIWLMKDSTKLHKETLQKAIVMLDAHPGFALVDEGFFASFFNELRSKLLALLENEKALFDFNRLSFPLASKFVEELIASTLAIQGKIGEKEIKAAVLAALFSPLRQSVGSCFATAPAILIQKEQPLILLYDLIDLLTTGKLMRVVEEGEYKVPLSITFGGEFLLKQIFPNKMTHLHEFTPFMQGFKKIDPHIDLASLTKKVFQKQSIATLKEAIEALVLSHFELTAEEIEWYQTSQKAISSPLLKKPSRKMSDLFLKVDKFLEAKKHIEALTSAYFSNPLLKAWEFTLASMADYKVNAFKWNMIAALGFDPEKGDGIGRLIYRYLEERLKICNQKLLEMQGEYERARQHLESIQALMASVQDVERLRRLKSEGESSLYHLRTCEELMDAARVDATEYSKFFHFLLEQYELQFSLYFQEVYDPSIQEIKADVFEDSPAGFRLLYKHGRSEPKAWQLIFDAPSYITSLQDFFRSIETSIIHACLWEKGKEEIGLITHEILHYLDTKEFIEGAFARARVFGLSSPHKTPWSYVSGGTLETLVGCYFELNKKMQAEELVPKTPLDLGVKLVDLLKDMPTEKQPESLLLMQSPTHAFLIDRTFPLLKNALGDRGFTYTWVRDSIITPSQSFYGSQILGMKEQEYLLERVLHQLKFPFPHASFNGREGSSLKETNDMFLKFFRRFKLPNALLECLIQEEMIKSLPLISHETCFALLQTNPQLFDVSAFSPFEHFPFFSFYEAVEVLKWCSFKKNKMRWEMDDTVRIENLLSSLGFSPPPLFYFADTNWSIYHFALGLLPLSFELGLLRVSPKRTSASLMHTWQPYFGDDSKKWKIFSKKSDYEKRHVSSLDKLKNISYKV